MVVANIQNIGGGTRGGRGGPCHPKFPKGDVPVNNYEEEKKLDKI